jgi:thiamine biosynthesis lipoprotein
MSAPSALPAHPDTSHGITLDGLWHSVFRAMASPIRVQLRADSPDPARCFATVRDLFAEVERQCTRFDPASDLMRANAAGENWQTVGGYCLTALEAAYDAHLMTDGMFEPRVLETLAALGYGASWAAGTPAPESVGELPPPQPQPWTPGFDETRQAVRVGPRMIDLGGIGKGLTLRWAAELLRERGCDTFLVDAGGDLVAAGGGPDGSGWRVGVEDPFGGAAPVAVLNVVRGACATSSTRLRRWRAGGEEVHHLIDPRTGRSGGQSLRSVTVVTDDPAEAEVWSKTLFLHGDALATVAADRGLAALWVTADKLMEWTEPMAEYLLWWPT